MHHGPGGGADRQQVRFGDRMRHGHEFDLERPERQPRSLCDDLDRHVRRARLREAACVQQSGGETRRINRAAQTRPERGDGADVILMRMGHDQAEQIFFILFDEGGIGQDQIDARHVGASEGDAAIDHDPFALAG
jgi:hypothetical protein